MSIMKNAFEVSCTIGDLLFGDVSVISGHELYFERAKGFPIDLSMFLELSSHVRFLGVTQYFMDVVDYFHSPNGETPAGFRAEYEWKGNGTLLVDLKRDIGYGKNSIKRGTGVLFSADCANPYEIRDFRNIIANITTNPAIIYNTFINNEKANVGHKFTTREQVMKEIADIVGSGVDISVELNNPFADENEILEEVAQFEEILSPYRLVVKVPHLGPISSENISSLLSGKFPCRYNVAEASTACRSHDMAVMLHEHGYRVNFTLMAEPHQTAMALQAKPAFINTFMRNRYHHNEIIQNLLDCYKATEDESHLSALRDYFISQYYLSESDRSMSLFEVKRMAEWILKYREWKGTGADGLDQARHNLRLLRMSNLPETKLIICSLDTEMYAMVDKMLAEDEFADMNDRVIITASPSYLSGFTSSPAVLQYNRAFITAASKK